ncbi:exopolysaccharide biosynthesis protein [Pseudohalioglobus sediminis]|uniref:Exopolysaccharide biosynthesis protein n=1 Tax=Pseudohalioglobus sediminis TaxID=2606449 RepID=A0A5B0WSS3_9GAMM|nr:CpsD/CapB family tyrosine-protein kinase [Pseudohalioglobus sediminis]KAA1189966.1 exopolysaccharide biosynthesis protein [Pseudohalioglobus sediminis]
MDYLQEAIEKAREQREGAIGKTRSPGEKRGNDEASSDVASDRRPLHSSRTSTQNARTRGARRRKAAPKNIEYQKTRCVEPPQELLNENRIIAGDRDDPRVEAYRQLRSQVLSSMNLNGWSTLAVTGPREDVGKTLTAINLAISISQEVNQTVMLVDLDLREPSVCKTLGIEVDKGIVDHLQHGEPLENILINPGYPRLVVVPGLPQGHHASELLTSPEMMSFLADVVGRYRDRIVVFDLPPLLRNDDAMVFVPNTDACLLVVEDGGTNPDEIERCMQLLKNTELLGTVLNKAR